MNKLLAAAAIANIACSLGQVGVMAFGLWRVDQIAAGVKESTEQSSTKLINEIRDVRADLGRWGR